MTLPPTSRLAQRHGRVRAAFAAGQLDAVVVTTSANIRYLANHIGSAGILVLTPHGAHLLIDFRYEESTRARQASSAACPDLRVWPVTGSYDQALADCVTALRARRVGFEAAHLTVARHAWLSRTLTDRAAGATLVPTERLVERQRVIKDIDEIAVLRDAASRLTEVMAAAQDAVRVGVTERAVAGAIEAALRASGYESPAFETIVASGPNGARPHYRAGAREIVSGDLVVLDFGGVLDGYCCDLTRTVAVGDPSEEARRVYAAVHDAQAAAIARVRPGVLASDVDHAARQVLDDRGLGEAFGHGTGHGLGLDVHEEPRIAGRRPDVPALPLEAGMVFTIEPGAYIPGWGGVRIEDDVLVTETGCDVLTSVTRELVAL